jgi:hypothetical protein
MAAPSIADLNEGLTWVNLRDHLQRKLLLPENARALGDRNPEAVAARDSANVLRAFVGFPKAETLTGPVTLLRGTSFRDPYGMRNNPFGGWWFSEELLLKACEQLGAGFGPDRLRREGVREGLRSSLALSNNWNDLEQMWCMRLAAGQKLTGLTGPTSRQPVDSSLEGSLLSMGDLPGGAWQYFFPNIPRDSVRLYPYRLL